MIEAWRNPIILLFLLLYLAICLGVGWWAMRRTRNTRDFFMAGRSLGPIVVAFAIFSSTLSGFGFVGGPGLVYSSGISSMWMVIISTLGYATGFFLISKRIRLIAELRDNVSLPDIVAARYKSEAARFLTAIAILFGVMGYMATQVLAMSVVMQSIINNVGWFGEVSLVFCMALSSAVLIFYCVTGGIIASVYTDVIQGLAMAGAGALIVFAAYIAVEGGFGGMSTIIHADDPAAIGPFGTHGIIGSLSWYFVFGIGLAGQPHIITKMMMTRNLADNRYIMPASIIGYALAALLWLSLGLAMKALVIDGGHDALGSPDMAAAEFLQYYAHPILAGIVFAALFAAIMSTADGFLNVGTAAIIHDIPIALRGRSVQNELFWARVTTIGLALVAAGFALFSHYVNDRLVAILGVFGWGAFAAAIVPVVALGLNWRRATPLAACSAIVISLLINLALELFAIRIPWGIHGGFIALLTSMTIFIIISLLQTQPKLDEDIEVVMKL
ncbi:MAG: sodium/proline symporter [Pseudomonadota bacterium]